MTVPMTETEALSRCASYRVLHPRLYSVAAAMAHHEGFYRGSRAWRNNNPGNLRSSPLADGNDKPDGKGMATFATYYHGLAAMMRDLWGKCTGHTSSGLSGESTVRDLIAVWAPSTENDVEAYVKAVVGQTGVSGIVGSTRLRELL